MFSFTPVIVRVILYVCQNQSKSGLAQTTPGCCLDGEPCYLLKYVRQVLRNFFFCFCSNCCPSNPIQQLHKDVILSFGIFLDKPFLLALLRFAIMPFTNLLFCFFFSEFTNKSVCILCSLGVYFDSWKTEDLLYGQWNKCVLQPLYTGQQVNWFPPHLLSYLLCARMPTSISLPNPQLFVFFHTFLSCSLVKQRDRKKKDGWVGERCQVPSSHRSRQGTQRNNLGSHPLTCGLEEGRWFEWYFLLSVT